MDENSNHIGTVSVPAGTTLHEQELFLAVLQQALKASFSDNTHVLAKPTQATHTEREQFDLRVKI